MAGILATYAVLKIAIASPGSDGPFLEISGTDKKIGEMLVEFGFIITSICWPLYWLGCAVIYLLSKR